MHFLGIDWQDRKPYLAYRPDETQLEKDFKELRTGDIFTIEIGEEKICVGYRDEVSHEEVLCSGLRKIWKKDLHQCFQCRNHETHHFFALESLSEEQSEILRNKNHFNYLNLFGNDIVKVGVATEGNRWRRILEQGADSTLFFTETDGITARKIENFVSKNFEIKQAVTYIQKVKLLKELIPEQESKAKLLNTFFQIKLSLPEEFSQYLLDIPEFSYNDTYYGFRDLEKIDVIVFIDNIMKGDIFSGQIIGIAGQMLLYKNDDSYYALNTNKAKGFLFEINEKLTINNISPFFKKISYPKQAKKTDLDLF